MTHIDYLKNVDFEKKGYQCVAAILILGADSCYSAYNFSIGIRESALRKLDFETVADVMHVVVYADSVKSPPKPLLFMKKKANIFSRASYPEFSVRLIRSCSGRMLT